jgi:RNA recognition motif-containing protein
MAKLYVGNLPWETEEQELRGLFASCGNVLSLEIPKGRQERSRGYALVEYSSPMEAAAAVQRLNGVCSAVTLVDSDCGVLTVLPRSLYAGHSVGGREISVREDKPVPPKSERAPKSERPAKASGNAPAVADGLRVYVGNLAWETTDEELIGAHTHAVAGGRPHTRSAARES